MTMIGEYVTVRGPCGTTAMLRRGLPTVARAALFLAPTTAASAAPTIAAEEAMGHVGETATVCGVVASSKYATSVRRQPAFMNLDRPYQSRLIQRNGSES